MKFSPSSLLLGDRSDTVWLSAAVTFLLQTSVLGSAFRDGIPHALTVTNGYLSYCCLSIDLNQTAHFLLTFHINKTFVFTQLSLTGYFLFFRPISVKPGDGSVWKSQQIISFWNTNTSLSGSNNHDTLKVTQIAFFHLFVAQFEHQQAFFNTSRCLKALSCM